MTATPPEQSPPMPVEPPADPPVEPPADDAANARATARRKYGRAGRNLPAAIGVGVVLAGLALATLYGGVTDTFLVLIAVALGLALHELLQAFAKARLAPPAPPLFVGALAVLPAAFYGGTGPALVTIGLTVLAILFWRLVEGPQRYLPDTASGLFAVGYIQVPAAFAALLVAQPQGNDRVVAWLLVTVGSDVGGYVAGVLFGRHPMAPAISPAKSWEGFAGSLVACVGLGVGVVTLLLHDAWWKGVVLGVGVCVAAVLGDLVESALKRDLGVKDMGSLLPGHGGVLDRVDSLIATVPVAYVILTVLVGS